MMNLYFEFWRENQLYFDVLIIIPRLSISLAGAQNRQPLFELLSTENLGKASRQNSK